MVSCRPWYVPLICASVTHSVSSPLFDLTYLCWSETERQAGGWRAEEEKARGTQNRGKLSPFISPQQWVANFSMPFTGHHAHTYAHAQTHKHTQKPALHMTPNLHDNQLPFIVLHHAGKPVYSLCVKEKESQEKESRRFVCFRVCFCILRATACRLFSSDCVFEGKCLAMFWQSSGAVLDSSFSFTHTFRILWTYCWKTDL